MASMHQKQPPPNTAIYEFIQTNLDYFCIIIFIKLMLNKMIVFNNYTLKFLYIHLCLKMYFVYKLRNIFHLC
jgi:hypothetical protein